MLAALGVYAAVPSGVNEVSWENDGTTVVAQWLTANDRPAPKRVIAVDDRLTADQAIKYAAQGVAMLWLGDYHNGRQILGAMDRRLTKTKGSKSASLTQWPDGPIGADEFYRIRQARAQRSRMLSLVLVPIALDSLSVPLPRAPKLGDVIQFGYGDQTSLNAGEVVRRGELNAAVSLQELIGVASAHQWYVNGVDVPALGGKIHPHYGTFLPTRHEYVDLVAQAPLGKVDRAFDIGTGTGVLTAVLAKRGVASIVATDIHQRAVDCANDNFTRLGIEASANAQLGSMFPTGRASLIVCNPPWLPGSAATTLDAAIYDPGSKMLLEFLARLPQHLENGGEGWLILSDLAELLGLRTRTMLTDAIDRAGLTIVDRLDTVPRHAKALNSDDPLHAARSREVTSLWRLQVAS